MSQFCLHHLSWSQSDLGISLGILEKNTKTGQATGHFQKYLQYKLNLKKNNFWQINLQGN